MKFSPVEVILLLFEMAIFLKFDATFSASHNLCCDVISMTCSVTHTQDINPAAHERKLAWEENGQARPFAQLFPLMCGGENIGREKNICHV